VFGGKSFKILFVLILYKRIHKIFAVTAFLPESFSEKNQKMLLLYLPAQSIFFSKTFSKSRRGLFSQREIVGTILPGAGRHHQPLISHRQSKFF